MYEDVVTSLLCGWPVLDPVSQIHGTSPGSAGSWHRHPRPARVFRERWTKLHYKAKADHFRLIFVKSITNDLLIFKKEK